MNTKTAVKRRSVRNSFTVKFRMRSDSGFYAYTGNGRGEYITWSARDLLCQRLGVPTLSRTKWHVSTRPSKGAIRIPVKGYFCPSGLERAFGKKVTRAIYFSAA